MSRWENFDSPAQEPGVGGSPLPDSHVHQGRRGGRYGKQGLPVSKKKGRRRKR